MHQNEISMRKSKITSNKNVEQRQSWNVPSNGWKERKVAIIKMKWRKNRFGQKKVKCRVAIKHLVFYWRLYLSPLTQIAQGLSRTEYASIEDYMAVMLRL